MKLLLLAPLCVLSLSALAAAPSKPLHVAILGVSGNSVGEAVLTESKKGVKISLHVSELTPGVHGFHIHEKGVCTPVDFKSAGGHLAIAHKMHGKVEGGPHEGDLPNISVGKDGKGHAEFVNPNVTLKAGANSLLREGGTSLVIHAKADDEKTQPAGDSGDRIACGIIAP
ncbi:MAG: superoxide dismutase family protein [Bdellovibrionota bacterium]